MEPAKNNNKVKIFFDLMGGDYGFQPALDAAYQFSCQHENARFYLFGPEAKIKDHIITKNYQFDHHIIDAPQVITQNDNVLAVRKKPNASMSLAFQKLASEQGGDSFMISCGNSSAFMFGCHTIIKPELGFNRIGFMIFMPTLKQNHFLLLADAGANKKNSASDLLNFALYGTILLKNTYHIPNPRVGLLNIGVEATKGLEWHLQAYHLLSQAPEINFGGNCEPNHIADGKFDVIVTDGYAGNIAIKSMEGCFRALIAIIKQTLTKNLKRKVLALGLRPAFRELMTNFSFRNYGGAVVCGLRQLVIKCHGGSKQKSFLSALNIGYQASQNQVITKFHRQMQVTNQSNNEAKS